MIPIVVALLDRNLAVVIPAHDLERAVADERVSLGRPVIRMLLHDLAVDRERRLVREQHQEVGRRAREMDFERLVVDGLDADVIRTAALRVVFFAALDGEEHVGILRGEFRTHEALPRELEVLCCDRVAIRPLVVPQMERVRQSIVGDVPAFRGCRDRLAVLVEGGETFEDFAEIRRFRRARRLVRIHRLRLRAENRTNRHVVAFRRLVAAASGKHRTCRQRSEHHREQFFLFCHCPWLLRVIISPSG